MSLSVQPQQAFDLAKYSKYSAHHDAIVLIFLQLAISDYGLRLLLKPKKLRSDGTTDDTLQPVAYCSKSLASPINGVYE